MVCIYSENLLLMASSMAPGALNMIIMMVSMVAVMVIIMQEWTVDMSTSIAVVATSLQQKTVLNLNHVVPPLNSHGKINTTTQEKDVLILSTQASFPRKL